MSSQNKCQIRFIAQDSVGVANHKSFIRVQTKSRVCAHSTIKRDIGIREAAVVRTRLATSTVVAFVWFRHEHGHNLKSVRILSSQITVTWPTFNDIRTKVVYVCFIRIVPIWGNSLFPSGRWKSVYRKLQRENARLCLQFVRSRNWCRARIMNANSCQQCNSGERLETASQLQYLSVSAQ